ncbi:MAC/Perforin domain protein [Dysgonomonas sp. HDW5B]|uniref:MAC/perforin domain-containing protein n=1 Tax=Dysgonomonas sp. HDW5B TaxID=2714927 RepID=UPI00140AAD67|nr:MAC/perforin domain-containing protein [Dysgonomonas sp. HDW5B]QIK54958.1 MAC/Perforin domain protein [Dysgonomonas sp. HDW5B]
MKKIYLLLMLCIGFSSCMDNNVLEDQGNNLTNNSPRSSGDGLYDVLGYGYDVMGEYLHPLSVKNPVLDVQKYKTDFASRLIVGTPTWGKDQVFYGYNSIDYLLDITKETNAGLKLTTPLKLFTGSISGNSYLKTEYSYSSKYSFASVDAIRNQKYIRINDEVSRLRNYLSKDFTEDLNRLTADRIVEKYGTHVITDFVIGGRYKLTFRSVIQKTNDVTTKKNTVAAGLGATLAKIGFNLNADRTVTTNESLAKENQQKELYISFYGGSGTNMVYNLEKGIPTAVDIKSWENTVKINNANLNSLNWNETYPIYEFITDATKKAQIKAAVDKYIASKQINLLEITPLYRYNHEKRVDHFYTTYWAPTQGGGDWKYEKVECYILPKQVPGSVPLYEFMNNKVIDHFYSQSKTLHPYMQKDWQLSSYIVGYVFPNQSTGTVPLYQYWSEKYQDHFYTLANEPVISGYWNREGVMCHVFPE